VGRGGVIDTRALRGRPYAVTFLYTSCPDVCPAIANDLRDAVRGTSAAVVAVSVDPRGDTPTSPTICARWREVMRVTFPSSQRPPAGADAHSRAGSDGRV
jgi:cytochrome oxidase Cu insertion factor (SCO1/SenC/PrrC family)